MLGWTLAASGSGGFGSAIFWLFVVLLVIGAAVAGVMYLRWWMKSHLGEHEHTDLTLQDLREMLDKGQLSKTEYESARHVILGKMGQSNRQDSDQQ